MSIRTTSIQKNAEKCIPLRGDQTVGEARQALQAKAGEDYRPNNTYLVVSMPGAKYRVALFLNLESIAAEDSTGPLADLPIPEADYIFPKNTPKTIDEILELVNDPSLPRVVITDEQGGFLAIFASENMEGRLPGTHIDSAGSGTPITSGEPGAASTGSDTDSTGSDTTSTGSGTTSTGSGSGQNG